MINILLVLVLVLVVGVSALLWYDYVQAEEQAFQDLLELHRQESQRARNL